MPLGFRDYLQLLEGRGALRAIEARVDPKYEISAHLYLNGAGPALRFERVAGSQMRVVGNLLCSRERIALGLQCTVAQLQQKIVAAIGAPMEPKTVQSAPCQEVVEEKPDLGALAIPTFFEHETGPYLTAGIIAAIRPTTIAVSAPIIMMRCNPGSTGNIVGIIV